MKGASSNRYQTKPAGRVLLLLLLFSRFRSAAAPISGGLVTKVFYRDGGRGPAIFQFRNTHTYTQRRNIARTIHVSEL